MDKIADAQYSGAFQKFAVSSNDWAGFSRDMQDLTKRFPQGWHARGAVMILASNVQARAELGVPPVKGEGLTDEDRALAKRHSGAIRQASMTMRIPKQPPKNRRKSIPTFQKTKIDGPNC